ncbi:hypothetical protein [Mammaliicoccus sciuri]|uniref:hypothetical protein n=1 Tax=Mammaliicoccus sciuri TaxID=1296 RepID=UPI003AECD99A
MEGLFIIILIMIGIVIYQINHHRHVESAKKFLEKHYLILNRDLVLNNVNHIIKDEAGELKFVFNSDVFREIYPDKLEIVANEKNSTVKIVQPLRINSLNLKNLKTKELSNISTEQIKNESTITIRVTKEFINQYII